jgi:hypothetical protein
MANNTTVIVRTALRRYAIQRDDVTEIRLIAGPVDLEAGYLGRPCQGVELGPLLDPADHSALRRRRALLVPMRRRYIALLVDYIDTFLDRTVCAPLPALLRERLREPWAVGALIIEDDVVVQLDLRAVARSVLSHKSAES